MTDIGEAVAVSVITVDEDKCIFCGKSDHENPKKEIIKPTGWVRGAIEGVGGRFSAAKKEIYPDGVSPPQKYRAEGHHCLAFSSFIVGAQSKPPNPKDRFAVLNYYLNEKEYNPNDINNRIDLPGRRELGDTDEHRQYKEFTKAVDAGKPLQPHIGGHADKFMNASSHALRNIIRAVQQNNLCKLPDDEFKNKILSKVQDAEDKAFKKTAGVISPWICHPEPIKKAEEHAKKTLGISEIVYPKL